MDISVVYNALAIAAGLIILIFTMVFALRKMLYVCAPNEILIFSGIDRTNTDGDRVGYRVLHGGRAFRIPILEKVDRMDMRLISVPMRVRNAYSEGGIPLTVEAVANIKVASDERFLTNAIERFLGHQTSDIARVGKETLEGHLRGVVATMTPEEVNEDRLKFASRLTEEAESDLQKLGLQLDTLKIQAVSDDRKYLDSIGRICIAEVLRSAEIAESDAIRDAQQAESEAESRGAVSERNAQAKAAELENGLRQYEAELDGVSKSAEVEAVAAAEAARATSEKELQEVRSELEQFRLQAELTLPAEAQRRVQELLAAGESAAISEHGSAMAKSMNFVAEAWKEAGDSAMDIMVIQNLETLFKSVTEAARKITVEQASLVDGGDGEAIARYAASYPATVRHLLEQVSKTLGVDVLSTLGGQTQNTATHSVVNA
jgi:flotillin